MKYPTARRSSVLFFLCLLPVLAAANETQPLDHDVYTEWNVIEEQALSPDGNWALWSMAPEENDGVLELVALDRDTEIEVPRGEEAEFSHDSRHAVFLIAPPFEEARQAERDEVEDHEHPKAGLGILDLGSGELDEIERVDSYRLPEEAGGWVAYHHALPEEPEGGDEDEGRDDGQEPGTTLVLRNLESGEERRFSHVSDYELSANGELLAFTVTSPDGERDGVFAVEPGADGVAPVMMGKGKYPRLAVTERGDAVAFLAREHEVGENNDPENGRPEHAFDLYHWRTGTTDARRVADEHHDELPEDGWHVSQYGELAFSEDGARLFFGTAPEPVPEPDHGDKTDEEIVDVEIWHKDDDLLYPMQKVRLDDERERTYLAVIHLADDDRLVQLASEEIPGIELDEAKEADLALGISDIPYRQKISWDFPRYFDAWLIDVASGETEQVLEAVQYQPELSPEAAHLSWWDRDEKSWYVMDVNEREVVDVGAAIPEDLHDHTNDRPFRAGPYGMAGWLEDDAGFLVYDRYDVWFTDPADPANPRNLTEGHGRDQELNFRHADVDAEAPAIDPEAPFLLSAFDENSKDDGFFLGSAETPGSPEELVHGAYRYSTPRQAEDSDRLLFTRENFQDFPDVWVASPDFSDKARLSDANPQQADYRWGEVELVEWTSDADKDLQGLLFKPEDFDPDREYPMIVYFYERDSDGLHNHRPPQAHRSVIIPTFYTSNDYVVFVPDIKYREGYPGESAMEAIMPKTRELAGESWIDEDRVGIQGHSWAGYQIAYMVTQTDFFEAAAGGAPVSNMVSAYGGIRWRTGMSRMFQYERTQSRIGGTLWEKTDLYLENSPIFMADEINTPLLMMHNDQDGAVPWEQGIELFTALRRLDRPAWLVNYSGEPHWPTTFANRKDWQKRLQQYFDHYLKDEPAARWIQEGIPAIEQCTTRGYDPVE